jgi:hypothetical protein
MLEEEITAHALKPTPRMTQAAMIQAAMIHGSGLDFLPGMLEITGCLPFLTRLPLLDGF